MPFFVKLPGRQRGAVSDNAVRTIDVPPTIAKAAGVRLPCCPSTSAVDGELAAILPARRRVTVAPVR